MPERSVIRLLFGLALASSMNVAIADEILRDPTRPYVLRATKSVAVPRFTVNAIFVSGERRIAIVNGRRVGIGRQVDGATVIAISKDKLTLKFNGKPTTVKLGQTASAQ